MYVAAVLNEKDRAILLKEFAVHSKDFENYEFWSQSGLLPHHMTINLGKFDAKLNPISILNQKAVVITKGFYYDHSLNVCATKVHSAICGNYEINTINEQPHITMAVRSPGKPVYSNQLNWNLNQKENNAGYLPTPEFVLNPIIQILK